MSAIVPFGFTFSSVKMYPEGLELGNCSCTGVNRYFIPRAHVDYITSGRLLYIKTLLWGLSMLVAGVFIYVSARKGYVASNYTSAPNTSGTDWLIYVGAVIILAAIIAMIPNTMSIGSNSTIFTSTKCCNSLDDLISWLHPQAAATLIGIQTVQMPMPIVQMTQVHPMPPHIMHQQSMQQMQPMQPMQPMLQQQQPWSNNGGLQPSVYGNSQQSRRSDAQNYTPLQQDSDGIELINMPSEAQQQIGQQLQLAHQQEQMTRMQQDMQQKQSADPPQY
jgi:hypothetical protein